MGREQFDWRPCESERPTCRVATEKGTYLARVIDQTGRISETTATVSTKQATVLDFAATDTIDEAPAFSGAKTNLTVDSGKLS